MLSDVGVALRGLLFEEGCFGSLALAKGEGGVFVDLAIMTLEMEVISKMVIVKITYLTLINFHSS